jgi:hypothetical protein
MIFLLILALYVICGVLLEFAIRRKWLGLEWFYAPTFFERAAVIAAWPCVLVSIFWKTDSGGTSQ